MRWLSRPGRRRDTGPVSAYRRPIRRIHRRPAQGLQGGRPGERPERHDARRDRPHDRPRNPRGGRVRGGASLCGIVASAMVFLTGAAPSPRSEAVGFVSTTLVLAAVAVALGGLTGIAAAQVKPDVLVKQRQSAMTLIGKYWGPIAGMAAGKVSPYNADVVSRNATYLEKLAQMPWDGFH